MTQRGIAVTLTLLLLLSPIIAHGAVAVPQPTETDSYTTGRPVDNIAVEASENGVSLLVSDDNPQGTTLTIDRDWLRSHTDKPIEFVRFFDDGTLIESYELTKTHVIISIPHFSTQNITATAVDAQFEVSGSASGQETTRVINYDVNETGIAILEIHGQGTQEGEQRVDQFFSQVDNSTFTWSAGEIPRNVSLEIIGQGSKIGPKYNKSHSSVSDGSTVFFDLVAKDYWVNTTLAGAGQKKGTVVTKGVYRGQADGDTQTLTFNYDQNNESVVFTGNTTTSTTSHSDGWSGPGAWDEASQNRLVHENFGDHVDDQVELGYNRNLTGLDNYWPFDKSNATDVVGTDSGSLNGGITTETTGILNTSTFTYDGTDDYVSLPDKFYNRTFTLSFWTKVTDNNARSDITWFKYGDINFMTMDNGSGGFTARIYDGASWQPVKASLTYGKWIHWTIVSEEATTSLKLYKNGKLVDSRSDIAYTTGHTVGNAFGAYPNQANFYKGKFEDAHLYSGTALGSSQINSLHKTSEKGYVLTQSRSFTKKVDNTSLQLENVKASLNGQSTSVVVDSDPDGDGVYEESSHAISLNGSGGPYDVTGLTSDSKTFRVNTTLSSTSVIATANVTSMDLTGTNTTKTKTTDPAINIDADSTLEASSTGTLNDSETVTVGITENVSDGSHTFTTSLTEGVVDWKYQGNNEARSHVKNVTINGISYTVDEFLNSSQSTTVSISNTDTLQGENSLTVNLYGDSETQYVDRVDVTGRYENRTVVDNYTINGQLYNLDTVLADGERRTVNVTDAVYGDNTVRVQLKENTTQDNYDAEFVWYPENRTTFTNVTVEGVTFDGPDDYSATTYNATFLGAGDVLTFNVTDQISPGDNSHTFRQLSPRTTTDTLDFVEKVEFHKNVTVTIEERHATYNKSTTESFNHTVSKGASFNFSTADRVISFDSAQVAINGTQAANTTTWDGETVSVRVDEEIPKDSTVKVRTEFWKYSVVNATQTLRDENPLSEAYLVDVGIADASGDVDFRSVEHVFDTTYEVVLTEGGAPDRELESVFFSGNITIPQSEFDTADGVIVQRPKYSQTTYTGTTNTIHPTEQITNRSITHDPLLYTEPDAQFVAMHNYSVSGIDAPVDVTWKQVSPYHLQWITDTTDPVYNQTIANVTGDGVQVLADGEPYRSYERTFAGDLVIQVNSSTTWDVYQYDFPEIRGGTDISTMAGTTETVQVEVYNPNDFTIHNTRLILEHGWIDDVTPVYQDIGPKETATYEVTITVPAGTEPTDYTIPMNVTSSETGEVDVEDLSISVGGGAVIAGTGIPNIILFGAGIVFLLALVVVQLARTGQLQEFTREVEEL